MVVQKIKEGNISNLTCAESCCKKPFNDRDIKNLELTQEQMKLYEKLSLDNAIAQMDDMGWCPLPSCGQIAHIERDQNLGKCTFCDFMFCLDCKERVHPFKRCLVNRVDLIEGINSNENIQQIMKANQNSEDLLSKLYMKHCTKSCPNPKCGVPITKIQSGCTQLQCPKCFNYFCWCCNAPAKGQKHYKENPDHYSDEGTLLPESVTPEIIQKYGGGGKIEWVNLKFCVKCPGCSKINVKKGTLNMLNCEKCEMTFCYICNKEIKDNSHYSGKANCRENSDPYHDF